MLQNIKITCLIIILVSYQAGILYPQNTGFRFEHISVNDGLSENLVTCILQDKKGLMWFGTNDGLNRYDGYEFLVYRHDPTDSTSISNNRIWAIYEDQSGTMWIGTWGGGLNKFDREKEEFISYKHNPFDSLSLSNNIVRSIYEDPDEAGKVLWIGTLGGGLNKFNRETKEFTCYKHNPNDNNTLSHNDEVWSICEDQAGTLWIGTHNGLDSFDRQENKFIHYKNNPADPQSLSHNEVITIYQDKSGILWIGTNGGLNKFDPIHKKFACYRHDPEDPTSLSNNKIRAIWEDKVGNLWIGTQGGGISLFDRNQQYFIHIKNNPYDASSLSANQVWSIDEDRTGNIWIGTDGGGLNIFKPQKMQFVHYYKADPGNRNSLSENYIMSVLEDRSGVLWVGVGGSGLHKIEQDKNSYTKYAHDAENPNSLSDNYVSCIYEDSSGELWIGTTRGGLNKFDPTHNKFIQYQHRADDPYSLSSNYVSAIFETTTDENKTLWIGTARGGLNKFDVENGRFVALRHDPNDPSTISDNTVTAIYQDRSGFIWIGTQEGGLNKFDHLTGQFRHFQNNPKNPISLSTNHVLSIYEDKSGALWIGTFGGGLNKFDRTTECFIHYTNRDGLPNNVVYGILGDAEGCLWISTNSGLSKFNPQTDKFRNFDVSDGLQSNQFTRRAYYKTEKGKMYFGGVNGLNAFFPDSIKENPHIPAIVIIDLQIFNKSVSPGDDSPLKQSISETEEITLSYTHRIFSFKFAALEFTTPEKNQYAYKMEGFHDDWIYVGNQRIATFINLPPGNYVFRVKGSNNDGLWNEEGTSVLIIITPPWWRTHYAYVCYIFLFLSLLLGLRKFELRRSKLRCELSLQRFESHKLQEIDTMKSRFFANISHEFRTPLTLILGPLGKMLSQAKGKGKKQELKMMQRNAQRLQRLINQLLDLSKIEAGKMTLHTRPENIVASLNRIVQSFESQAKLKRIDLKFQSERDEIIAFIDRDKIENIFYNLLSNALKFTPEGGTVACEIQFVNRKSEIVIAVVDTGIGIPSDRLDKVFDRFYQVDDSYTREHEGSGIGLALTKELVDLHHGKIEVQSELNKGTTFTVYLPIGKEHLKPEEIIDEPSESSELSEGLPIEERSESLELSERLAPPSRGKALPLVLIVEDNADMRSYLQDCLASDYRVIEAVDGEDGLHRAINKIPDLVISDVMMPKMDGFEMCGRLKSDERTSHIPVILLTARASAESKIKGLELGADDYLVKPFDRTELLVRAKNLIDQRRKLREKFNRDISLQPSEIAVSSYDQRFLQRAMEIIEQHLSNPDFDITTLTREVGMSRMQLHRKLLALTNKSANNFIRSLRLKRAAELLSQHYGNVAQIAYEVGFNNPSYFAECFRKQFGKLPSEYVSKIG